MEEYTDKIMRLIDRTRLNMDVKKWLEAPCPPDDSIMVALDDIAVSVLMTIEEQPLVKAVPLDKVKKAREEIEDNLFVAYGEYDNPQSYYEVVEVKDVLKILDKLIESEEKNENTVC